MENLVYRQQGIGEEIANSISHGLGFLAAVAITPVLVLQALTLGLMALIGAGIFCASMMLLYLASTLYHAFPPSKTKKIFQLLDHGAIFILIAGTYTPFTISIFPNVWGWILLGIIWVLAISGIILKSIGNTNANKYSTSLYLGLGWAAVLAVKPLWTSLPTWGIFWLLAGGIMYSVGVLFFIYDHKIRYSHFVWHLFVLAGTSCHVVAVLGYVY
jgi:hemolysin III